ncbi:MAG TPA: hypothetical protein VFO18_15470 [Methylomirabilota bacterium]|nr:hypothetical protein [Methylomirabilota bacterium]
MRKRIAALVVVLLASASYASADDAERLAMAHVRLTTEAALVAGCARVGSATDDSLKDLRRKIVRAGGNAGLLSFRADDLSAIHAEIFQCPSSRSAPPRIPPPPPGPPPPPPPPAGPTR